MVSCVCLTIRGGGREPKTNGIRSHPELKDACERVSFVWACVRRRGFVTRTTAYITPLLESRAEPVLTPPKLELGTAEYAAAYDEKPDEQPDDQPDEQPNEQPSDQPDEQLNDQPDEQSDEQPPDGPPVGVSLLSWFDSLQSDVDRAACWWQHVDWPKYDDETWDRFHYVMLANGSHQLRTHAAYWPKQILFATYRSKNKNIKYQHKVMQN